jgi:hypothetical protein
MAARPKIAEALPLTRLREAFHARQSFEGTINRDGQLAERSADMALTSAGAA